MVAHWLVEISLAGRIWRFADQALDVPTMDGDTVSYAEGLGDIAVTVSAEPLSIAIAVSSSVSWAQLAALGHELALATCTLRRWFEDEVLEDAEVVLHGDVIEPEYGAVDEALVFTVERSGISETGTVPPRDAVIDATTWPITTTPYLLEPDPDTVGLPYPWVYGRPGRGAGGLLGGTMPIDLEGSPAYITEYGGGAHLYRSTHVVVCGCPVAAPYVKIRDKSGGYTARGTPSETLPVVTVRDLRGRDVAALDIATSAQVHWVLGNDYEVIWIDGGGRLTREGDRALQGLGEILEDMLTVAGVRTDRGRMAIARQDLDAFEVDFALTERVRPVDFAEALTSILPLARRESERGVWFELIPDRAPDAIATFLTADIDGSGIRVERTSTLRSTPITALANEIELRYAKAGNDYAKRVVATGRPDSDPSAGDVPSLHCAVSRSRYGERLATASTDIVYDDATARLIVSGMARRMALPRRTVGYKGGLDLGRKLELHQVVEITDSAVHLDRAHAVVLEIVLTLVDVSIVLELLDDHVRRRREAEEPVIPPSA